MSVARLVGGFEFFGVFDGHGPDGHFPSERAALVMPAILQSGDCADMVNKGRIDAALIRAFDKVQDDLIFTAWPPNKEDPVYNLPFSGTAAVCALRNPSQKSVWIAHCGDSRAALLVPGKGVVNETQDHTPKVESERERVEAAGCEVIEDDDDDEGPGAERIFIKGEQYPGIMMSRSLGDLVVKRHGVISEPEVQEWSLDGCQGAVLIIASG